MKALLATLVAGGFLLLSVVALELMDIRRSLRRIERDDRQLVVVVQQDLHSIHPAAQIFEHHTDFAPPVKPVAGFIRRRSSDTPPDKRSNPGATPSPGSPAN